MYLWSEHTSQVNLLSGIHFYFLIFFCNMQQLIFKKISCPHWVSSAHQSPRIHFLCSIFKRSSGALSAHWLAFYGPAPLKILWRPLGNSWFIGLNLAALRMVAYQIRKGSGGLTFFCWIRRGVLFPLKETTSKGDVPTTYPKKKVPPIIKKRLSYKQYIYDIWYIK